MIQVKILELFSQIHRRVLKSVIPVYKAEGLAMTEVIVLRKLKVKGPCRASELAGLIGISPSTLTGVIDRLEAKGLLERVADPNDRRSVILKGTPALEEFSERIESAIEKELQNVFKSLPSSFSKRFLEDLEILQQYLEREEGEKDEKE